jgi:hypothetical protein
MCGIMRSSGCRDGDEGTLATRSRRRGVPAVETAVHDAHHAERRSIARREPEGL